MLYQTKLRMLEKMKAPICWTWCEKATSVGNSSSWLPRVWTVWTYFMLMPPHHYLAHTLHTLKKHILSSGWCSYLYALISSFCSKYPRKILGFHTWYWPYRHLWGLWAPNHAGDWCSRWQLANQMVMRNMITDQIWLIHLKKKWWWLWSGWWWRQCYDMTRLIYSLPTPNGLLWLFLGQIVKLCSILFTLPIAPKYFYALSVFSKWTELVNFYIFYNENTNKSNLSVWFQIAEPVFTMILKVSQKFSL